MAPAKQGISSTMSPPRAQGLSVGAIFTTGLALFAMFFGAGNVSFPLIVGQLAAGNTPYALMGLCLTAVLMPIIGLIASVLFACDYHAFFGRLGKIPSALMIGLSLALLGPLVGIPRTITVAYSSLAYELPQVSLWPFSLLFCGLIYLCTRNKSKLVDLIGVVLTPLLLLLLLTIIVAAYCQALPLPLSQLSIAKSLWTGAIQGYNTLDLIGALFFSSIIFRSIRDKLRKNEEVEDYNKAVAKACMQAGLIGGSLLALVYVGTALVSAMFSATLSPDITAGQLMTALAAQVLGPYAGVVTVGVVLLACLTTAISLVIISTDFVFEQLVSKKINCNYLGVLLAILGASFAISLLGFHLIVATVAPLIILCYPVYIVLCLGNIAHKLLGLNQVKVPAAVALLLSIIGYFYSL